MVTPIDADYWFTRTTTLTKGKNYRPLVAEIISQTDYLSTAASLPQRLWHIIQGTDAIPGCKVCGATVSWDRRYKKYKTYCGNPRCPNIDPDLTRSTPDYTAAVATRQQTNLARYGTTNYLASVVGKEKTAAYRQDNPLTTEEYARRKAVRERTMLSKHGVVNISHVKLLPGVLEKLEDPDWLYQEHYVLQKSLSHIAADLHIPGGATTVGQYLRRSGLITQTHPAQSHGEKEIIELLQSMDVPCVTGDRTIIAPYELDMYIPSHKLAIEYCGLYWHSEQQGKHKHYHATKHDMCKALGIQLITVFEDEWKQRRSCVISKLRHLMGVDNRPVVYARMCSIFPVTPSVKRDFLDSNHIQGVGPGSIAYGLFSDQQLVAVMTFIVHAGGVYTLNRYATSHRVVGGFSKLLSHFKRQNKWTRIISFADKRWSTGHLYESNGWILDKLLPPDYYYSPDGHTRVHKFNYRRKNLPRLLKNFDASLSETVNCDNNGVLRIWDCGKVRYVLTHGSD